MGRQPWALSFPDKELCLREALAVCTPPAPDDLVEKKESPKGERAVKPVISLPSDKWVLKIGFLKVQNW